MIHPRYKQMPARVRMTVNSMSLPEIRGNPIQAKPVRSTRPEAKAVRLSLPVARARAHVRRIRKSADRAEAMGRRYLGAPSITPCIIVWILKGPVSIIPVAAIL